MRAKGWGGDDAPVDAVHLGEQLVDDRVSDARVPGTSAAARAPSLQITAGKAPSERVGGVEGLQRKQPGLRGSFRFGSLSAS